MDPASLEVKKKARNRFHENESFIGMNMLETDYNKIENCCYSHHQHPTHTYSYCRSRLLLCCWFVIWLKFIFCGKRTVNLWDVRILRKENFNSYFEEAKSKNEEEIKMKERKFVVILIRMPYTHFYCSCCCCSKTMKQK